jgi:hypothetical protein
LKNVRLKRAVIKILMICVIERLSMPND